MDEERTDVLRDLADIARVANGPSTPYVALQLPTDQALLANRNATTSSDSWRKSSAEHDPHFLIRDRNAVQYTKSQLVVGDTLVIVRYPNNQPVYDATGFQLSDKHRVDSDKLKAASPLFKQLLEDDWQQHRFKRRNKLIANLPDGIKYVLDLTPPEEGDEALELTADLSCSLGLRRWYKSEFTECKVSHGMVGGQDETTNPPKFDLPDISPPKTPEPESERRRLYQIPSSKSNHETALEEALVASKKMQENISGQKSSSQDEDNKENETLDYCPIRHRTGIERLLQVIEGKDPRLDSAPKVWTLAVLANYFKCPNAVVDYIVTWMIAEPNCKIFDILPEDALRIGFLVKNETIARNAFPILVSEEALRVGTARQNQLDIAMSNTNAKQTTKFGRPKESLDEDIFNSIQHAGRNFHARIEHEVQALLDPQMMWLQALPEFRKILRVRNFIEAYANPSDQLLDEKRSVANSTINDLMNYTRGRIFWVFFQVLDDFQRKAWNENRWQEQHIISGNGEHSEHIFDELTDQERLMTRYYWETLRLLKWNVNHSQCTTNLIHARDFMSPSLALRAKEAADRHEIPVVHITNLRYVIDRLNVLIVKSIKDKGFNDGIFPEEAYKPKLNLFQGYEELTEKLEDDSNDEHPYFTAWNAPEKSYLWKTGLQARDEVLGGPGPAIKKPTTFSISSTTALSTSQHLSSISIQARNPDPRVPMDSDISPRSPFFAFPRLLAQIDAHIQSICNRMLSRNALERSSICDTLLCLSDDEYKYLPLWANGLDDGSGGVFEIDLPPAERGGPIGPGPSYHTGSTLNSRASTENGFDDDSSVFVRSIDSDNLRTSIGVEDGFSADHVDRRRTLLERDILTPSASEASFDLLDDEVVMGNTTPVNLPFRDKGKGKEIVTADNDSDTEDTFSVIHHPLNSASAEEIAQQVAMMESFSSIDTGKSSPVSATQPKPPSSSNITKMNFTSVNVEEYDADTFYNVADDDDAEEDFDFGVDDGSDVDDDDGNLTETESETEMETEVEVKK